MIEIKMNKEEMEKLNKMRIENEFIERVNHYMDKFGMSIHEAKIKVLDEEAVKCRKSE